jgi:hypothetical protein
LKTNNRTMGIGARRRNSGPVSKAVLVGNLHDRRINAFNATTGSFIGSLTTPQGKIISESGLWGIAFGGGTSQNG